MKNLHETVELLPAPGLAYSRLSNYWGHRLCNAGAAYMDYVQKGEQDIDLAFLDDTNTEINRVFGFDTFQPPNILFNKCLEGFLFCYYKGKQTAINPPYDEPDSLDTIIEFRLRSTPSTTPKQELRVKTLSDKENQLLDLLITEFDEKKQPMKQAKKEEVLEFVAHEVKGRTTLIDGQIDRPERRIMLQDGQLAMEEIWTSADDLDDLMPQEAQERILGECRKDRMTDQVIRSGIRGAYAISLANMSRAMWNEEAIRELSGAFYAMQESWHFLMDLK